MSEKLIECVPNFSEGRDLTVIKQITDVIEKVENVKLLDVDPGADMNRTVVTFVGDPKGVKQAAFEAIKKASELIDMSKHTGSHPRMGATDVCPFVPVSGVTIEECIELSKEVAEKVGKELNIPIYLYEKSAQKPERVNLANIRKGEYEGLENKLKDPKWKPDFGPTDFNAQSGATVIGVREFLIAYNINLNTREKLHAIDIAYELREKGRSARRPISKPYYYKSENIIKYEENSFPCGECDFIGKDLDQTVEHCKEIHKYDLKNLLNQNTINEKNIIGNSVKKQGLFDNCKAIGWMVDQYDRAQISINLTNYKVTSMHDVLEATRKLAADRGLVVTGSEIVGMVPYPALLEAGKYYLKLQGRSVGIPINDILSTAVQSLGLTDVATFNIEERVLGLPKNLKSSLVEMKLSDFIDEVSRESPAPGGGSIAALAGSLGAALSSMVSNLSSNNRGSEEVDKILNKTAEESQEIKQNLLKAIDEDTNAFNEFMEAKRLPNKTDKEKQVRNDAMLQGLKNAVFVPYKTAEQSFKAIEIAETVAKYGNPNSITDVGVGAQMAYSGVLGGIYNVLINLKDIKDIDFCADMRSKCEQLKMDANKKLNEVLSFVEDKL
ncbi:MAG: glutamate formimidoyltransferase [Ignavibacteriales bacterium]|nr:glutamate formimidoyltransferase [Ignavibacteriales bacterium]MCB9219311.1 glutamate formimidoyltransferase [Ignavibacteriales bacterium]MCB9260198.1 glutamate formimidoyltransferase [Ignavibacteriales bacterium]